MEPTIQDIASWVADVALSSGQLQKAYDWQIAQWSGLANAIVVSTLALLSSALIESFKDTLRYPHFWSVVVAGTLAYVCIYVLCRLRIHRLRQEFLALYTLLMEIK